MLKKIKWFLAHSYHCFMWRLEFTRRMQERAKTSFLFAWEQSDLWVESFGMEDLSGAEAADEEMSNWD